MILFFYYPEQKLSHDLWITPEMHAILKIFKHEK